MLGIWLTYIIWSIVAVSNSAELKHGDPDCDTHFTVWMVMVVMLICNAVNICVMPCLKPDNAEELQVDPVKRMAYMKSCRGVCCIILGIALVGVAIAMMFIGIGAWSSTDGICEDKLPSDLWMLFKITVVLYSIVGIVLLCVLCCVITALCCGGAEALGGGTLPPGAYGGSAPAYYSSTEKAEETLAIEKQGLLAGGEETNPVCDPETIKPDYFPAEQPQQQPAEQPTAKVAEAPEPPVIEQSVEAEVEPQVQEVEPRVPEPE